MWIILWWHGLRFCVLVLMHRTIWSLNWRLNARASHTTATTYNNNNNNNKSNIEIIAIKQYFAAMKEKNTKKNPQIVANPPKRWFYGRGKSTIATRFALCFHVQERARALCYDSISSLAWTLHV
jgi:hypothetical protein